MGRVFQKASRHWEAVSNAVVVRMGANVKTKAFTRFRDKAGIPDLALCRALRDAERGLIAADLGGGVIK